MSTIDRAKYGKWAEGVSDECLAHWERVRASIPNDIFKAPPVRPTVFMELSSDEAADVAAFRKRRADALKGRP